MDIERVDFNLLKVFEALYGERDIGPAALRLETSRSEVKAAMLRLQETFSDALFVPTRYELRPTSRAKELQPVVSESLEHIRQTLATASNETATFRGRSVSIGMSDDIEIAFGRKLIESLTRTAPGLHVQFLQTHTRAVGEALTNHDIDLAVFAGRFAGRGLQHTVVGVGTYACLVDGSQHKNQDRLTVEEFVSSEHIHVSSCGLFGIVDECLAGLGGRRTSVASTTHYAALPYLLKGTKAVATVPKHAAVELSRVTGLVLLPCPVELPSYPIALGWRRSSMRATSILRVHRAIYDCIEASDDVAQEGRTLSRGVVQPKLV